MSESGIWWIGLALLVLAAFPLLLYAFFSLVVLERKSQGLIDDLKSSKAFEIQSVKEQLVSEDAVKTTMKVRYGYKRFFWPVALLVFFNLVGFSIVWDILNLRLFAAANSTTGFLYSRSFLAAAELPMMTFIGVLVLNYSNMLRRLYLWDVTTQVYWNALQRTWASVAVAAVLAASGTFLAPTTGSEKDSLVRAHIVFFGIGFIATEVIRQIIARSRTYFQIQRLKVDELPLSLVQGINFMHEIRLEEEGVENVQNLATCDLIELAMATRYNLRTLLDWVDQAILIHRMGVKATKLREAGFVTGAIDMAWASPENANGDLRIADQVAKTVEAEPIYVSTLMNSLYQDAQIHLLWDMWQSKLDSRQKEKNVIRG